MKFQEAYDELVEERHLEPAHAMRDALAEETAAYREYIRETADVQIFRHRDFDAVFFTPQAYVPAPQYREVDAWGHISDEVTDDALRRLDLLRIDTIKNIKNPVRQREVLSLIDKIEEAL